MTEKGAKKSMAIADYVCPSCGTQGMFLFYQAQDVPVNSCVLLSTQQQALDFPRGDIILGFCKTCGFISNVAFDPLNVDYSSVYEDQQCFSSTFNVFAKNLATRLIKKHHLYNKQILEIGCGKGDFLALLCEEGHNDGVGIDPAYVKGRIQSKASNDLTFIRDYYNERYADHHGDFICCRHTLEHIPNTAEFVKTVRNSISNRLDTIVFFEVPDTTRVLHELAFWDIYYEHCSYFTLGSLARLFRNCKFEVTDLAKDFDNQYLLIEAKPLSEPSDKVHKLEESVKETAEHVKYFSKHFHKKLDQWKNRLHKFHQQKKNAVIWGSGSKCVAFMTTLGVKDEIRHIIDINPHRHGKFIPGAGKEIMPPEFLKECKPDITIVMNPIYYHEITQMLNDMEVNTEVIAI
jgi:SAM-dependent methyltransferase/Zn ribbon nucleic-acid-binding protein